MIGRIISQMIGPLFGVIDEMVEDKDEANRIKMALQQQMLANEAAMTSAMRDIIVAEAQGNWLQSMWRPLMMLWFAFLLGMYWFGMAPEYLTDNPTITERLFDLLNIGIGGYIASRGIEKIAPHVAGAVGGTRE